MTFRQPIEPGRIIVGMRVEKKWQVRGVTRTIVGRVTRKTGDAIWAGDVVLGLKHIPEPDERWTLLEPFMTEREAAVQSALTFVVDELIEPQDALDMIRALEAVGYVIVKRGGSPSRELAIAAERALAKEGD